MACHDVGDVAGDERGMDVRHEDGMCMACHEHGMGVGHVMQISHDMA